MAENNLEVFQRKNYWTKLNYFHLMLDNKLYMYNKLFKSIYFLIYEMHPTIVKLLLYTYCLNWTFEKMETVSNCHSIRTTQRITLYA